MWPKKTIALCLLGGSALSVIAMSCADHLTGQIPEPEGPLLVTRLTLLDKRPSRDVAVFTDTSLPDCKQFSAEFCSVEANRATTSCRICYNDVLKDTYSLAKSPPTPDSGRDIRVVFNKVPLLWNGQSFPQNGVPEMALRLECDGCRGIPPYNRLLDVSGSALTYDPKDIPYGPALRIAVDTADPRAALEPDTSFRVYLGVGLGDRRDNRIDWQGAAPLLRFKTEPMKLLRMGRGDATSDPWVYASTKYGDGSTGNPYSIADLARNSAIVLRMNASVHPESLATLKLVGSVKRSDGSSGTVDVLVGTNVWKLEKDGSFTRDENGGCVQDSQRFVYLGPDTPDLRWPPLTTELNVTVSGGSIKDVAQQSGYPVGAHAIASDVAVRARPLPTDAAMGYAGQLSAYAKRASGPCVPAASGDMGMTGSDGGTTDMAGDMSARDM